MDQVALSPSLIFIKFPVKNLFMHSNFHHEKREPDRTENLVNEVNGRVFCWANTKSRGGFGGVYSCIYLPLNPGKLIYISLWIFI